ncbi:MAG: methyltransferase domain-containing protein, partial [Pseudomonadota bacterium]
EKLGKSLDTVSIEDLAPADEFHIGGRPASIHLCDQLKLAENHHVLDVGCGIGGPARFVASEYQCHVTGVDLTQEYVETGNTLNEWVGLQTQVSLHQGSALSMPFDACNFEAGYMMHVGMNIEDKQALYAEISRVMKPGSTFAIYDIMRFGDEALTYPVPWSSVAETSFVTNPDTYKQALESAGFEIVAETNRRDFALEFFKALRERTAAAGGPPPLGLQLVMGSNAPTKIQNLVGNITKGGVAPVEIIARKS